MSKEGVVQAWKGRPPVGWSAWQEEASKGTFLWDRENGAKGAVKVSNVAAGCLIQGHPARPGERYAVRARRSIQGQGEASIRIRWQTAEGKWTAESQDALVYADGPREDWQNMLGVVEVPQGAGKIVLLLLVSGQASPADVAWFDEVELYKLE